MRIRKLEIQGFKSFADRVVIQFDTGVTGIVGPNGCGKSNVVDALRWVMGEQNAKHLRGDTMQDVIFNGSQNRGPLGMAEVVLTLENDGLGVPTEYANYSEIEIARRVYKTGDSEYEINRKPCRLRDITELFLGTGVGTKAYSIIEQGRVSNIVQAKPEERRQIIEEAAGITKYKTRRNAAEKKMESTQQNLMRISDVLREVETQLGTLERQAKKAARYHELQAEIKQIDLHHSSLRFLEFRTRAIHLEKLESAHLTEIDLISTRMQEHEAVIEAERENLVDDEKQLNLSQAMLYEAENAIALSKQDMSFSSQSLQQREQQTIHIHEDMRRLEGRSEQLVAERDEAIRQNAILDLELAQFEQELQVASQTLSNLSQKRTQQARTVQDAQSRFMQASTAASKAQNDIQQLNRQREHAQGRSHALSQEAQSIELQRTENSKQRDALNSEFQLAQENEKNLQSALAESKQQQSQIQTQLAETETRKHHGSEEIARKQARLQSLEEIENSYDWGSEGLSDIMKQHTESILGLVADHVQAPVELEDLLENVLRQRLETIMVNDVDTALRLSSELKQQEKGLIRFFINHSSTTPSHTLPSGMFYLQSKLQLSGSHQKLLSQFMSHIVICPSMSEAISYWPTARQQGLILVCMSGELLDVDGSLVGGAKSKSAGVLGRKREIRELALEIERLISDVKQLDAQIGELQSKQTNQSQQIEKLRVDVQNASLARVRFEESLRGKEAELKRLETKQLELQKELDTIANSHKQSENELEKLQSAWASALEAHRQIDESMPQLHADLAKFDAEVAAQSEIVTTMRIQLASSKERSANLKRTQTQATTALEDAHQQRDNWVRQLAQIAEDQTQLSAQRQAAEKKSIEAEREKIILSQKLAEQRAKLESKMQVVRAKEQEIHAHRQELEAIKSILNRVLLDAKECELALKSLSDRLHELYRVRAEDIIHDFHLLPEPEFNVDKRLSELKRSIDQLGSINPNAVNEFNELSERHNFLKTQCDDLTSALAQLESAIQKLNETTVQRFDEAFRAINERFSQVFPRLFRGGKAWLQLTQPDDLLSTGVEIFAEPPGKKLSSIALMSGGEKALTATSLIFAIFLIKPSPFCLLDEVDAPLDEANVDRFSAMVKEMSKISQFIVITHNKRTMEVTDQLYGVTMEQPGISKTVNVRVTGSDGKQQRLNLDATA